MIAALPRSRYPLVQPLLAAFDAHVIVAAALEGTSPAGVFVDDLAAPDVVFLATAEGHFLAGRPGSTAFVDGVHQIVAERVWRKYGGITLFTAGDDWAAVLPNLLGREPIVAERLIYVFDQACVEYPVALPDGYVLRSVAAVLNECRALRNLDVLHAWIASDWNSTAEFLTSGFGCCVVHGDAIASWSLSDCVSGTRCEIGIETDPAYRRHGLATIAASAAVAQALERGHGCVGWHCWAGNAGSRRVAERVGFRLLRAESSYVAFADEARHARYLSGESRIT